MPHVGHAALQIPIETAVHTVVGTKSMGEAFRGAVLNGASQAVHRSAANALGANAADLGAIGHKIGHVAAATAASHISSGGKDFTSSLINGANAVLGEMLMEATVDRALETAALKKEHPDLSPEQLNTLFQEQTANRKHLAIWTSGALGGLFGGDVGTSASLAGTAIDHNFMTTSKKLFYGNEEEEVTTEESFLRRYTEENNDPEEGSQFGVEEEKKVRAALGGTSSRPHTQQEYARALDPSGFIARSVGRRYEGSTPAHAALSEVLTPQWQSEVRASVHRFDAFMAETETMKPSQRVQIGEDFRGKAQAFSKEELNQRPRSNSAAEREMAAYFWALTENQDPEVEATKNAQIHYLEAEEKVDQARVAQEEATGWMERLGARETLRDELDSLKDARSDLFFTDPNEILLGARRAFQERNKPLAATLRQDIQETETFYKENRHVKMTQEVRQHLFDLHETLEFVETAHTHIPVNAGQGIMTGLLYGTMVLPFGKELAQGPRYLAKAFSATSKGIRATERKLARLSHYLKTRAGKAPFLENVSGEGRNPLSHFEKVIQDLTPQFVQSSKRQSVIDALGLETGSFSRGLISKSYSEFPSLFGSEVSHLEGFVKQIKVPPSVKVRPPIPPKKMKTVTETAQAAEELETQVSPVKSVKSLIAQIEQKSGKTAVLNASTGKALGPVRESFLAEAQETTSLVGQEASRLEAEFFSKAGERHSLQRPPPRTDPKNLKETLVLEEAKSNPGLPIMEGKIKDSRFEEYIKMQYTHRSPDGNTTVHYWQNKITGERMDFKFTKPSSTT